MDAGLVFTFSIRREIRQFHVVVVQRLTKKCTKSVMHVQSCCLAYQTYFSFCRARCRRLRR